MSTKDLTSIVDSTAIRVALWRALHLEVDALPHIIHDDIGLKLINPDKDWRERPDMHPLGTAGYRASIVARARFLDDLVKNENALGINQYVILGAGLDTFAQRYPELGSSLSIFEVDKGPTQNWKKMRLLEIGYSHPEWLKFVPVDFERDQNWFETLDSSGFNREKTSVISSTGVSMYLTKEANEFTLKKIAQLAPGSVLAMTFMLTLEYLDVNERPIHQAMYERARAAGTPFLSFYTVEEMKNLALHCGFKSAQVFMTEELSSLYFSNRSDGLRPSKGEAFLIAKI